MATQYRRGRHSVTDLQVHLVFVTKYRRKIFTQASLELLRESFIEVARKMDFKVVECNGEADHIHLLVEYPPKLSISVIVNHLKGVSSRIYRKQFPSPHKDHLWSPAYFAVSCGGAPCALGGALPIETLKKYIENQKSP
jgi:putative transposase